MPRIGVIGGGTMGAGIAQVAAAAGCDVSLLEVRDDLARKALDGIAAALARLVEKGKLSDDKRAAIVARIRAASAPVQLADCDLVIEAVVENLDVKTDVFRAVLAAAGPQLLLATNTSSLSVTKMAATLPAPERLAGMHFFNPVPLMPLVEVISGERTAPATADAVARFAADWGKTVVRAKDTPGFIVNRVARGYYLEALRMLGDGLAPLDEIDRTMRNLGRFRMGPFELMDLVGIDVNYNVSLSVWEQMGRPARLAPHPLQRQLFEQQHFGRKTKRGAYSYETDPPTPALRTEPRPFAPSPAITTAVDAFALRASEAAATADPRARYIFARILATIINEAAWTYDDGVSTIQDIDTAMRLGTNYLRGPLEWAELAGRENVAQLLLALNDESADGRFAPARFLSAAAT